MPYNAKQELLEVYGHNPTTLRTLVHGLSDDELRKQGTGDELWSILEVVCHLRDTEQRAFARVQQMVWEDRPFLSGYDPAKVAIESDYLSQSLDEALDTFEGARREQIAYLQELADEQWSRTAEHEEVGEITVLSLTNHMALHDSVHFAQISRRIQELRS
jgi:hypothetical protein